jgi:ferredoxin
VQLQPLHPHPTHLQEEEDTAMMKLKYTPLLLLAFLLPARGFSPAISRQKPLVASTRLFSSADSTTGILSISLEKPLGMILEEVEEGAANGVFVKELADSGSAYASEFKDQIVGLKVARVMDDDCTSLTFDDVMEKIIDAPSPLTIDFEIEETTTASEPQFEVGTTVIINVLQEGEDDKAIEAKVGDNLRQTLLDNNVEVYRGLKKKLGNCGGGGQCTFCAVNFVESEGWEPRSEYEETKIGKWPNARLACMNNIQGPATIRVE